MLLPLYLQGPPVASQIWSTSLALKLASRLGSAAVCLKNALIRLSAASGPLFGPELHAVVDWSAAG